MIKLYCLWLTNRMFRVACVLGVMLVIVLIAIAVAVMLSVGIE